MTFHVDSEVGRLRQVILHRPGLELSRLTPDNVDDLLFDDILWAKRAREEHDAFAQALRDRGVKVHYFARAARRGARGPEGARVGAQTGDHRRHRFGPDLVPAAATARASRPTASGWPSCLIGGVLKSELAHLTANSLRWELMDRDDFLLTPLPNHLFQRDNSAWMYGGLSASTRWPCRPECGSPSHAPAIYRFHPMFAGAGLRDLVRRRRRRRTSRRRSRAATCTCSATGP